MEYGISIDFRHPCGYNTSMKAAVAGLFAFLFSGILCAEYTPSQILRFTVDVEERLLQRDLEEYRQLHESWLRKFGRFSQVQERVYQVLQSDFVDVNELKSSNSRLQEEWNYVIGLQAKLDTLVQQIQLRLNRIEVMKSEMNGFLQEPESSDPLTGTWDVTIIPGDQHGKFRLRLSTTIISGDYRLDGGWIGSLKGTLVGDRIRLERIDSEKGFIAVYYGRLDEQKETITGTWESTMFTTGGPMTGTWSARKVSEP